MQNKFRMWDEKQKQWDNFSGIIIYPNKNLILHGKIIQQYIGMKDVNGKEIYEGDIVSYSETHNNLNSEEVQQKTATIMFTEKYAAWCLGKNGNCLSLLSDYGVFNIKIIGNIFENYDLIKNIL